MYNSLALTSLLLYGFPLVVAWQNFPVLCDVSTAVPDLPSGQTNLSIPSNVTPRWIGQGFGTQNYTCSSQGEYVWEGSMAEVIDISCLVTDPVFSQLRKRDVPADPQNNPSEVWEHEAQVRALLGPTPLILGNQYYQNGSQPQAVFNFGSPGFMNQSLIFATEEIGYLTAPNSTRDVDWSTHTTVQGNLAAFVAIVDTHFGQPPSGSCQPGSQPLAMRYAAKYWFYRNDTSSTNSSISNTGKTGSLNAALSSDSDSATLQKLLNYAPAILGLLALTTILSLVLVVLGLLTMCRSRRSSYPTRAASAAYRPVQLPRAKAPVESSYHDEPEPYGA